MTFRCLKYAKPTKSNWDFPDAAGKRGGNEAINYNTGEMEDGGLGKRDGESDEIMRALEKWLSKWREFDDIGWMDEVGL